MPPSVLSPIPASRCRDLLAGGDIGRVVIPIDELPTALPVVYRLIGDAIVFRTAVGTKLTAALNHTVVGFEVDEIDHLTHTGWSVLVTGMAHVVINPATIAELDRADIPTWLDSRALCYIEIDIQRLSGRILENPPGAQAAAEGP